MLRKQYRQTQNNQLFLLTQNKKFIIKTKRTNPFNKNT